MSSGGLIKFAIGHSGTLKKLKRILFSPKTTPISSDIFDFNRLDNHFHNGKIPPKASLECSYLLEHYECLRRQNLFAKREHYAKVYNRFIMQK